MKTSLSILLPVFNGKCTNIVGSLHAQVQALEEKGLRYEIIVADDGSTDEVALEANRAINSLTHCRYIERGRNVGRAAIRNYLAREACSEWLLFIDSDMLILNDNFIKRYVECDDAYKVVDGGVFTSPDYYRQMPGNLRCMYECAATEHYTAEQRQKNPYADFHTANYLISRDVMLTFPFDERFRHYGYEDVLLGKQLKKGGIAIKHIDNPVGFSTFESNESYVGKTEEGLRTLYEFRSELRGYSRMITFVDGIHLGMVKWTIRMLFRLCRRIMRRNLCGNHPSLSVFKFYKLGYYLSLF